MSSPRFLPRSTPRTCSAAVTATATAGSLTRVSELATPFALIDGPRLRRNILDMQQAVGDLGAGLRPHFKTHRAVTIAGLQLDAGAIGLTVATADQLLTVRRRFECPVLVSSLVQVDSGCTAGVTAMCADGGVVFAIESTRSVELLRRAVGPDVVPDAVIELEAGCLRTGIDPAHCGELARQATRAGCRVVGVFTYPGHGYIPGQARDASEQEHAALELGALELARAGFEPEHVSAGSTPTMRFARAGAVTEYRPGTYVFGDRQQLMLGSLERSQLTLTVVATVVARHGDRIVLDAGGKALGRDSPSWLPGYGQLLDGSDALITRLYDHHAVVDAYEGPRLAVGDRVPILANNANSVMALRRSAWFTEDGERAVELRPQPDR